MVQAAQDVRMGRDKSSRTNSPLGNANATESCSDAATGQRRSDLRGR